MLFLPGLSAYPLMYKKKPPPIFLKIPFCKSPDQTFDQNRLVATAFIGTRPTVNIKTNKAFPTVFLFYNRKL